MVKIRKFLFVTSKVALDSDISIHKHALVSLSDLSLLEIVATVVLLVLIILLLLLDHQLGSLEVVQELGSIYLSAVIGINL